MNEIRLARSRARPSTPPEYGIALRLAAFTYGLVSYMAFLVTLAYTFVFVRGMDASHRIDAPADSTPTTYRSLGEEFGLSESQVTNALHRTRGRFRQMIETVVAEITGSPEPHRASHAVGMPETPRSTVKPFSSSMLVM